MNAVIVVPYGGTYEHETGEVRRRNWRHASGWWSQLNLPIYTGAGPKGQSFDVTRGRNAAVAVATAVEPDWDVALMTDADAFLGDHEQARQALETALEAGTYVVAHNELRYIQPGDSERVTLGMPLDLVTNFEVKRTWETVFAFTRVLWEEIGGFDPRFRGFGHQVEAFFHAATTLAGDGYSIAGPCWHLWHPYSADQPNPHLVENRRLVDRYWSASGDEPAMRALLAEFVVAT
jgi:hypothetical protein